MTLTTAQMNAALAVTDNALRDLRHDSAIVIFRESKPLYTCSPVDLLPFFEGQDLRRPMYIMATDKTMEEIDPVVQRLFIGYNDNFCPRSLNISFTYLGENDHMVTQSHGRADAPNTLRVVIYCAGSLPDNDWGPVFRTITGATRTVEPDHIQDHLAAHANDTDGTPVVLVGARDWFGGAPSRFPFTARTININAVLARTE